MVTSFDWSSLQAAKKARMDAVPEMINHALVVLADLLDETNHACEFSLETGPLIDKDVIRSVKALLPNSCRVQGLEQVPSWRGLVGDVLPEFFLPTWQPDAWVQGAPARALVETLTAWVVALMSRLWPDEAECWHLTVETGEWYAPAYVDVLINHHEQVWLLHLGVTD